MTIEEAKDFATLPLHELTVNLKLYEMVLNNDSVASKTTKEKVKMRLNLKDKGGKRSKKKGACYNCGIEGYFASECRKPKENKAFVGRAWSDIKDDDEQLNDATCLMAIDSQEKVSIPSNSNIDLNIIDLQKENEELLKFTRTLLKLLKNF
uniref:CCHC-type domain-containing protein n=1 Tax=Tanacetum cinerariifolium TaxID=118510 RepID=A0A699LAW4_TANCI|nr:hypothetical protein [Tanacetum cinerariifolium]